VGDLGVKEGAMGYKEYLDQPYEIEKKSG